MYYPDRIPLLLRPILALALLALLGTSCGLAAQAKPLPTPPATDDPIILKYRQLIPQLMAEQGIPGLAVAVVDENGLVWSEGFGYTDNDRQKPVDADTIFSVQSTSKNFTAAAVLLAVQDGLLDLDAPITTYLPDFTVHSIFEEHPEQKITLRMLLSHTAGFTHEAPIGNNYDLGHVDFTARIRSISDTWLRFPVGTGYAYSNLGVSLAGYILQTVSGQPFPQYMQEALLGPIGMSNSSFDLARIEANPNRAVGHSAPLPKVPLEIPLIPEGGLYTSANDMAKYIQFHLNRGTVNGQSLLSPALLDEMYTGSTQDGREGYGLGVDRTTWYKVRNVELLEHGGGGFGFISDLWWLPEVKIGITVLTNSADHHLQGDLVQQILYDFVNDPNRVYYSRLMALPESKPVIQGDGQFRPAFNLAKMIAEQAMPPDSRKAERWQAYIGNYGAPAWGALDPMHASVQVYQKGAQLYLRLNEGLVVRDSDQDLPLTEVQPGLFFADNGEALDLRGSPPTWRNIKLVRLDSPPLWQKAVLAACALILLTGLLGLPLRGIVRRLHRKPSVNVTPSHGPHLAGPLACLTGLFGLVSVAMLVVFPYLIYSGFLGWLDLSFWLRLLTHVPFALLVASLGLLALILATWSRSGWSHFERIYYPAFSLATIVLLLFLSHWRLIGLSL